MGIFYWPYVGYIVNVPRAKQVPHGVSTSLFYYFEVEGSKFLKHLWTCLALMSLSQRHSCMNINGEIGPLIYHISFKL